MKPVKLAVQHRHFRIVALAVPADDLEESWELLVGITNLNDPPERRKPRPMPRQFARDPEWGIQGAVYAAREFLDSRWACERG